MDLFNYKDGVLYAEDVPVSTIATEHGTPCYIYSRATIEKHWHAFDDALGNHPHLICYSVKANSNLGVLNTLARLGSGFDIVSAGELTRVLNAGGKAEKTVFSGVGKRADEIRYALEQNIRCFNIESETELERINQIAGEMGKTAAIALRVNPDVDAKTHPYISTGLKENKFGIAIDQAEVIYHKASKMDSVKISGIDCHIGSQLMDSSPLLDAMDRLLELVIRLKTQGIAIKHMDLGGGLGIRYEDENPPLPNDYATAIIERLAGYDIEIILEPGRAIMGNAGILVTTVEYLKSTAEHNFAIVDAAMNDLLRPALYQAWQAIIPVKETSHIVPKQWDIVGPVCESADFLGKNRRLALQQGDLLAIRSSGAYGFVMSSNYNSRPRAAEVMVDGDKTFLIRERESITQLLQGEAILPDPSPC